MEMHSIMTCYGKKSIAMVCKANERLKSKMDILKSEYFYIPSPFPFLSFPLLLSSFTCYHNDKNLLCALGFRPAPAQFAVS